jgi:short-subunit dehydrogenase
MKLKLKKLRDQTIVITGASSGIGLATARMAAVRGARLVLAARNKEALETLTHEIRQRGGDAYYVVADVGVESDVREIARVAQERFGGFDTWINNAGTSIYGKLLDIESEDLRRLFETNFWGVVYGSLIAARHLRQRGGTIINLGSTFSDRAIPIQGMYSASKYAVKGFTDALRIELQKDELPVSVTLIKPSAIHTPFPQHAENYMDREPTLPQPLYSPDVVARTILYCAEHPKRDVFVGVGGKFISLLGKYMPRLADKIMEVTFIHLQKSKQPAHRRRSALRTPTFGLRTRGSYPGYVAHSSLYTKATLHPFITGSIVAGAGLALAELFGRGLSSRQRH